MSLSQKRIHSIYFLRQLMASLLFALIIAGFALIVTGVISHADTSDLELMVSKTGDGAGKVVGAPPGIDCGVDCSELYPQATAITLTAVADPGSTFTGWQGACSGAEATCFLTLNNSTQVTATFTLNQYSLTIAKAGNGSGRIASAPAGIDCGVDCTELYNQGTLVVLTVTTSPGSTFTGWQGACTGSGTTCSLTLHSNTQATATFTLNQYSLTTTKTGSGAGKITSVPTGIDCGADCTELYNYGTLVTLTATANPGSTFAGWQGACSGVAATCSIPLTGNTQVTALFTFNQYSLTATKVGNGAGHIASVPAGIDCGADCTELYTHGTLVTLTANADFGSTFTGWQGACSGSGAVCSVTMNAATAVAAVFTLNPYQLTAAKAGNGSGKITSTPAGIDCGNDCTEFYLYGSLVTVSATADPSATFAGWSGACTGANPVCTVTMDAAQSVTAIFILNQYTLSLTKSGTGAGKVVGVPSGIDCGVTCSAVYPHGAILTLTATADPGSTFTGWQGGCSGTTATCTVTMDGAKAVTALFTLNQYNLHVTKTGNGSGAVASSPSGIDCGSACDAVYNYGSLVSLTASVAANSIFTGWSGACTGTETVCTVTINATKAVTATFALKQYPLTVNKLGNGVGKVTSQPTGIDCGAVCSSLYNHDTVVTLTALAEVSSLFTGWQGACTNSIMTCTVTLDAAKAVTATFTLKQYDLTVSKNGSGAGNISAIPAGITCGITCTQRLNHGTLVTLTATAALSSTFTGWQGACTGVNPACIITIAAAQQVTATFMLKQYDLTVFKTGPGSGSISSTPPGINCGLVCVQRLDHGHVVTLTATPAASTLFSGWQGACTGESATCVVTINAAKQVTATFTLKQYSLTVNPTGSGNGVVTSVPAGVNCGITCTVTLNHGAVITLTAKPALNSLFTGWQGACSGATITCTVTVDVTKALTATFALKQYVLTASRTGNGAGSITSNPSGLTCGITCTLFINEGAVVTITATAALSSTFTGWSGACIGVNPICTFTMNGAKQVTATFALKAYDLKVAKAGNGGGKVTSIPVGIECGLACTRRADYGTVITLTATPDDISRFTGWQGACSGIDPLCTVTVTNSHIVTATFALRQYALSITKTGSGAGVITSIPALVDCGITCTVPVDHGAVVTLTATAGARSFFAGWAGACTGVAPCVVTMTAAQAITATFSGEPVVSVAAVITTTPPIALAGQVLTYHYQITNTGDLSLTLETLSEQLGVPSLTGLSADSVLQSGDGVTAVQQTIAPRCASDSPLVNTLTVTGTASTGVITTTQATITTTVNTDPLPPQTTISNTVYLGCTIHLALGRRAAALQQSYDMVVIVGAAPAGLVLHGVQTALPYTDRFALMEQTNALLGEGCDAAGGCRTVRRMIIEQGKAMQIEIIEAITPVRRVYMPVVRK